jgi:hypothetical protein
MKWTLRKIIDLAEIFLFLVEQYYQCSKIQLIELKSYSLNRIVVVQKSKLPSIYIELKKKQGIDEEIISQYLDIFKQIEEKLIEPEPVYIISMGDPPISLSFQTLFLNFPLDTIIQYIPKPKPIWTNRNRKNCQNNLKKKLYTY